jgi:hypothetical protein
MLGFPRLTCRAVNAVYLMALQWTKLRFRATLQCNVDCQGMIPKSGYRFSG